MNASTEPLALVVGGSGAIGASTVERLRKRGHAVVATYCGNDRPARDEAATWARFDADEPDTIGAVIEALRATGRPLRTVVYAAGAGSTKRLIADTPLPEFRELFQVNAVGLVVVWQAIAPVARDHAARVVVISSETTRSIGVGNGPYTASKAALEAIALTLAKEEAAHGVRVNVVAPALVASPTAERLLAHKGIADPAGYYTSLPFGRALGVDEVAELVVEVATAEHWRYATGQTIRLAADTGRS